MHPIVRFLPALLLAACSSVVPSTLAMLATTSPIKADPGAMAVALILPPGIAVKPNTAELKIGIARADTGEQRLGRYILIDANVTPSNISVAAGETLHVFQLSPKDADDMRRLQAELAVWEAEVPKGDGHGSLSVGLGGCSVDGGPAKDAVTSAYIRTTAGGAFLPLIDREPLGKLLGTDLSTVIKPCP
jgi:hypothetical protein